MNIDLENARRQETRYRILACLEIERPNPIHASVLLQGLRQSHLQVSVEELQRELGYLTDKGLIKNEGKDKQWLPSLLAAGVDVLEGSVPPPPGVSLLGKVQSDQETFRRKEIRWRLLRVLDAGRPHDVSEGLAWRAMDDAQLLVTVAELRRAAVYLEQKGLVEIDRRNPNQWALGLTAAGVDVNEYGIDCPPGIGRPEKWW